MASAAEIFFSFRSPYSWLACRRLATCGIVAGGDIPFTPFWEPSLPEQSRLREGHFEFPYTPMSKSKHLYILQDVKRLADRAGLTVRWPIDRDSDWSVPHLTFLAVRETAPERLNRLLQRIGSYRWERGENIWLWITMKGVLEDLGMVAGPVLARAQSEAIHRIGMDCLRQVCAQDVFGVPLFRIGRTRYWGLDRVDDFLLGLGRPAAVESADPACALADDHAGGCG